MVCETPVVLNQPSVTVASRPPTTGGGVNGSPQKTFRSRNRVVCPNDARATVQVGGCPPTTGNRNHNHKRGGSVWQARNENQTVVGRCEHVNVTLYVNNKATGTPGGGGGRFRLGVKRACLVSGGGGQRGSQPSIFPCSVNVHGSNVPPGRGGVWVTTRPSRPAHPPRW